MARVFAWLVVGASVTTQSTLAFDNHVGSTFMASMSSAVQGTPDGCLHDSAINDINRPIADVMKEHPDLTMPCYFKKAVNWVTQAQWSLEQKDFALLPIQSRDNYLDKIKRDSENPKFTVTYDGGKISTNNDINPYEDWYCHANKFMDLNLEQAFHFDNMTVLAQKECEELAQIFPDYLSFSMEKPTTGPAWKEVNIALYHHIKNETPTGPSMMDARRHAAMKCAVGTLAYDIANCIVNFCELADGYIGHGRECPDSDAFAKFAHDAHLGQYDSGLNS